MGSPRRGYARSQGRTGTTAPTRPLPPSEILIDNLKFTDQKHEELPAFSGFMKAEAKNFLRLRRN